MLVLLSSGARRRYSEDILRALALPAGAELQFRYEVAIVPDHLIKRISSNRLVGEPVIISFIHTKNEGGPTKLVPCRFGIVTRSDLVGSSCVIKFAVGEFASSLDDSAFRSTLSGAEQNAVPTWVRDSTGKFALSGRFVFDVAANYSTHKSSKIVSYEKIVSTLKNYEPFSSLDTVFFTVSRVSEVGSKAAIEASDAGTVRAERGMFRLRTGRQYDCEVYCFSPDKGPSATISMSKLQFDADTPTVEFPLGKSADVDSEYDIKRFRFTVGDRMDSIASALRLFVASPGKDLERRAETVIPVYFKGSLHIGILRVALIAIGSSAPAMIASISTSDLKLSVALLMVLAGVAAGIGTIFFG